MSSPPPQKPATIKPSIPKLKPKPHRQIRALHDASTITVYQAYNSTIASAAVAHQKLNASPAFRTGSRMTWIKPSWAWMLYRSGYSYKDANQERILALRMRHADFLGLLERGVLTHGGQDETKSKDECEGGGEKGERKKSEHVKIQWDPERTVRLDKLDRGLRRSIQIGIPGAMTEEWAEKMIVGIEDVTEEARKLKRLLDERPDVTDEEMVELGLVPLEGPYELPEELQRALGMLY